MNIDAPIMCILVCIVNLFYKSISCIWFTVVYPKLIFVHARIGFPRSESGMTFRAILLGVQKSEKLDTAIDGKYSSFNVLVYVTQRNACQDKNDLGKHVCKG